MARVCKAMICNRLSAQNIAKLAAPGGSQGGFTLIETIVAVAILGVVCVTFLNGMTSASETTFIADEHATAESLARSQMELIKMTDYMYGATSYPQAPFPDSPEYQNYSVDITAEALNVPDDGIQKITVTVRHFEKALVSLECYKVHR
jgi:prepilin-type N-terminal cleavage/methylation domain-containing protein